MGGGDGLLAEALHVEGQLLLALRGDHPRVEDARLEHRAQAAQQLLVAQLRVPRADGLAVLVEHADQAVGQVAGVRRLDVHRRLAHRAGLGQVQVGEIGLAARPPGGFGDVQAQGGVVGHGCGVSGRERGRGCAGDDELGGCNWPGWATVRLRHGVAPQVLTSLMVRSSCLFL
ncbi:hypothetical protein D9M69_355050 [compost metagenome]